MRLEHLERVDYRHAAAVVLSAEKFGAHGGGDETVIKTLTTAGTSPVGPFPLMVAEIIDPDHIRAGLKAYPGPAEIIATGLLSSRVLVQTARFPGLSRVVEDLFDQEGVQIFLHELPQHVDLPVRDLLHCFDSGVPIGIVRKRTSEFLPLLASDDRVAPGDFVGVIGDGYESSKPRAARSSDSSAHPRSTEAGVGGKPRRLLIVGWNNTVPSLLAECDGYPEDFSEIHVASMKPLAEREKIVERKGLSMQNVPYEQFECDFTSRAELERLRPGGYDVIMVIASDWLGSAEEADARSLLGYLMLCEVLEEGDHQPHIIVEAMVEASAALFAAPEVELLVTPKLQSHMLAQVTLRRDLNLVFDHLFGVGGAELSLQSAGELTDVADFYELQQRLAADARIALGILRGDGSLSLNPDKKKSLELSAEDRVVVLAMGAR